MKNVLGYFGLSLIRVKINVLLSNKEMYNNLNHSLEAFDVVIIIGKLISLFIPCPDCR